MTTRAASREADVVVVGGGGAGCVLASRLSKQPGRSVLLLEAGRDFPHGAGRPAELTTPRALVDGDFCWSYEGVLTSRQPAPTAVVRGRVIGGSGAVNATSFVRGVRADYDGWRSERWSWPHVLDAFRRLETDADYGGDHHGGSGPMPVKRHPPEEWGAVDSAFYETVLARGFPEQADLNEPDRIGIGPSPRNIRDGRRVDTSVAFLDPARHRPNLTVLERTHVRRVLFDGSRAAGVEVERAGRVGVVHAGAVVLSAGGIGSPQLLFLSGIGDADELRAAGLPVVVDLPGVGRGLADHPMVNMQLVPTEDAVPGPSTPMGPNGLYFTADGSPFASDLRIMVTAAPATPFADASVTLVSLLGRGVSRGRLHFSPTRPSDPPRIEYRYFDDPFDRQRGRELLRIAAELARTEPLAGVVAEVRGPTRDELRSDAALDAWILENAQTTYHSVGTCRLGAADDPSAVVDDACRVRGVDGLFVCDLSIAPDVPRAGTYATAVMIGERASSLVGALL